MGNGGRGDVRDLVVVLSGVLGVVFLGLMVFAGVGFGGRVVEGVERVVDGGIVGGGVASVESIESILASVPVVFNPGVNEGSVDVPVVDVPSNVPSNNNGGGVIGGVSPIPEQVEGDVVVLGDGDGVFHLRTCPVLLELRVNQPGVIERFEPLLLNDALAVGLKGCVVCFGE